MRLLQLFLLVLLFGLLGQVLVTEQESSQTQSAMTQAKQQVLSEKQSLLQSSQKSKTQSKQTQQYTRKTKPLHAVIAADRLGIKESPPNSNRGDSIDAWWYHVAVKHQGIKNLSDANKFWCGVFVGEMLWQGKSVTLVLSASSFAYKIKGRAHPLSDILYGRYKIKSGDLRLKLRNGGGHVDIVWSWNGTNGILIGGNVSNSVMGRPFTMQTMIADRTTYIIDIEGEYYYGK